jgi:hypothetical protein
MLQLGHYDAVLCDLKTSRTKSLAKARRDYPEVAVVVTIQAKERRHGILATIDDVSGYYRHATSVSGCPY